MKRGTFGDLRAFQTVARERSFTRAAALLGVSPSALSHTIRALEDQVGVRLLARTTRNVAPTEAGERLLATVGPRMAEIDGAVASLRDLRGTPSGTVRITSSDYAADRILLPRLAPLLPLYPDLRVEISIDYGLTDIVAERFDAGVRLGEQIERDMIAQRIGPDVRMAVIGSPAYFAGRGTPATPQDLTDHSCINLRLQTSGGLYAWEFTDGTRQMNVRVGGQLILNRSAQIIDAAVAGCGLACVPEDMAGPMLRDGRLIRVLERWCPLFSGLHLYYPSRRQTSAAFRVVLDALRYRAESARV